MRMYSVFGVTFKIPIIQLNAIRLSIYTRRMNTKVHSSRIRMNISINFNLTEAHYDKMLSN